jgi:hypothetical protein
VKQLVRAHAGAAKRLASRGPLLADLAGLPPAHLVVGRLDLASALCTKEERMPKDLSGNYRIDL